MNVVAVKILALWACEVKGPEILSRAPVGKRGQEKKQDQGDKDVPGAVDCCRQVSM